MDIWIFHGSFKFRRIVVEISSKFRRMCVQFSENSSKFRRNFVQMSGFRVSQQGASVWWLPAALRRPQKKHALIFLEHVSCGFCQCLTISGPPKPCASVSQLPAALRRPQTKTHPWIFGACILWILSLFDDFRAPQALCGCVTAACGASATSNKNTPLDFGSMCLVDLVNFHRF